MLPLSKLVFAYKVAASAVEVGARMTSVLPAGGRDLVAPEGKPLEDAFGASVCSHLFCTKVEIVPSCHLLLACPSLATTLDS